ncbi:hypothetical protein N7468_006902 [Penicillium chermesinum]|uniref:Annexin n=1 Tax=Penicillium chermesinum TaxID=63820 RepID=A0A9W9TK15_9EURO|nr:uncharacterized protein N7468_006902 [Penicillium chermesinum]KAJ5225677.1 hypothetical protein N7468_006902 [Penicillium chermesinum]
MPILHQELLHLKAISNRHTLSNRHMVHLQVLHRVTTPRRPVRSTSPAAGPLRRASPPQQGHYGGHSPQPPYGGHSPQPSYGHPPPGQPPYGAPPQNAYGAPPQHHGAPGYPPPPGPGYGAPPPGPGNYHAPGPAPGPAPPSPGYVPHQLAPGDFRMQCDTLRKAMKGFGTDEKALIHTLAPLDPYQMAAVRSTYSQHLGRDLYKDVQSETRGYFQQGLLAVIEGPLGHDIAWARESIEGAGTKEWLMNDILLGRSNADLNAIRMGYDQKYHKSLIRDVEGDLSFKTATLFKAVLQGSRHEDGLPPNPQAIDAEVRALHDATTGRMTNNVGEVVGIFARASNDELRAIDRAFEARYHKKLEKHIEKEFSGHMEDAFLHMLRSATDPARRDAILLEQCMAGLGTKDERLVVRVVRVHWNREHKERVKAAYRHEYKKDLIERVRGETSGDYRDLMVALLQ